MSTEILDAVGAEASDSSNTETNAAPATSSKNLSVENKLYRTYGFIEEGETPEKSTYRAYTKNEAGVVSVTPKPLIRAKTADGKAWDSAEAAGNTKLNENQYNFYTVENEAGFAELVPDEEQRIYLINRGIATIQTAAANFYQSKIGTDGNFAYDETTIDLRTDLNTPPERKKQTDTQKLTNMLAALDPTKKAEMAALLAQMLADMQG